MLPSSNIQASGEGQVHQVVVGETALRERLQLLSLSEQPTYFQITTIPKTQDMQTQTPAVMCDFSQRRGMLNYSGDVTSIEITFAPAPMTSTGLFTQEFVVTNSFDMSQQKLLVSMMVCAPTRSIYYDHWNCFLRVLELGTSPSWTDVSDWFLAVHRDDPSCLKDFHVSQCKFLLFMTVLTPITRVLQQVSNFTSLSSLCMCF